MKGMEVHWPLHIYQITRHICNSLVSLWGNFTSRLKSFGPKICKPLLGMFGAIGKYREIY